jgi:hypothetical protein
MAKTDKKAAADSNDCACISPSDRWDWSAAQLVTDKSGVVQVEAKNGQTMSLADYIASAGAFRLTLGCFKTKKTKSQLSRLEMLQIETFLSALVQRVDTLAAAESCDDKQLPPKTPRKRRK